MVIAAVPMFAFPGIDTVAENEYEGGLQETTVNGPVLTYPRPTIFEESQEHILIRK